MLPRRVTAVALLGLLILSGCGLVGRPPMRVTEADAGRTVELRPGDRLEIVLPGNPTTGYQWLPAAPPPTVLQPVGEPAFVPDSSALGAGGTVTLVFEAVAGGQTTLRLDYRRPFEANVPPLRRFELTVVVR